jgi:S-formylglutathione hydrolase FrmB
VINAILRMNLLLTVPRVFDVLAAIALVALLASRRWRRWLPIAAAVVVGGLLLGFVLCWLLGDVLDLFGVDLTWATRTWFAAAVAGMALAIARMIFSRGRAILVGITSALVIVLTGALGINADIGEFVSIREALGAADFGRLHLPPQSAALSVAGWVAPVGMPRVGQVETATIPPHASHFRARAAYIYLPPAALVAHPARLPVLIMLSGEPGGPVQLFTSGGMKGVLDSYAATHSGLAPIVIAPDQLGAFNHNPMCVNSTLGNAATYVTVDVPNWIRRTFQTLRGPTAWGVGGFSEGGTCAIQFGAEQPQLFGSIIDISGQTAPTVGALQKTINAGFGGSKARYEAAIPANIMRAHGRYDATVALICYGALDTRYGPQGRRIANEAKAAGMETHVFVSPTTAHDWHTVNYALAKSLAFVSGRWGLHG